MDEDSSDSVRSLIADLLPFRTSSFSHSELQPPNPDDDSALALLLPLLFLLSTLLFLLLLFLIFLIAVRRRRGSRYLHGPGALRLGDHDGPLDLSQSDEADFEGMADSPERRWLEQCSEGVRLGYLRAKTYQSQYRPNSLPTDITLSQFLSIQEKGVSAWAFEPDYDSNPSLPVIVQNRTELTFLADGAGMSPSEGGAVCVQSNLPLPKLNEVYYFECKIYEKPEGTEVAIGLATKPYPTFRLPGWNRLSIGYFASDGFKSHNYPFTATSYGPPLKQGDVLGVGYRPRTGAVFFTRNGKKLEDAFVGLQRFNVFPTVGATGPASVHVNLGQAGFVFIEANVKKWGLAPMAGTLAPPPAYGHQTGSILLASSEFHTRPTTPVLPRLVTELRSRPDGTSGSSHANNWNGDGASSGGSSGGTIRAPRLMHDADETSNSGEPRRDDEYQLPHNPPTPRPLDISLQQMTNLRREQREARGPPSPSSSISPPNYAPIDPYKYAAGVAEVMLAEQFNSATGDWRGIRGSTSASQGR